MGSICIHESCLIFRRTLLTANIFHGKILQSNLGHQCVTLCLPTIVKCNIRLNVFSTLSLTQSMCCPNVTVVRPKPKTTCPNFYHGRSVEPSQATCVQSRFNSGQASVSVTVPETSSAWQIGRYGTGNDILQMVESRTPTIKQPHDVLIKVHATSVNPIDVRTRGGYGSSLLNKARRVKPGDEFPLTLGRDCSGVVVDIGKGVKDFKIDDKVWASVNAVKQGCHAEYVVCGMEELSHKPKNLTHVEAASIPYVAITNWSAAYAVAKFRPQNAPGKRALIFGGSGGIGTFGIQLLHAWGANVTVTCSENAFDLMRSIGAHHTVDYKSPDILQELLKHGKYDFILNAASDEVEDLAVQVMKEKAYAQYVTLITPFLNEMDSKGAFMGALSASLALLKRSRKFAAIGGKFRWAFAQPNGFALKEVAKLVENGKIRPVIDEVFVYQALPSAYQKVEDGHTRGKVVVSVAEGSEESDENLNPPELFQ